MRIAMFNIIGINTRLPALLAWLQAAAPDVVCLQELKAEQHAFPKASLQEAGYHAAWVGQRSWDGGAHPGPHRPGRDPNRACLDGTFDHPCCCAARGRGPGRAGRRLQYRVTPADIYNERAWTKSALIQPEPRAQFARLVGQGWTDALRRVHPEAASWTFWSVFHDSYARDAGMRIDHLLLSPRRQGCYGPGR